MTSLISRERLCFFIFMAVALATGCGGGGGGGGGGPSIDPSAPTASITLPAVDSLFDLGALVMLTGTVADLEDDPATLTVEWSSSIAGTLAGVATGPDAGGVVSLAVSTPLIRGEHTITLTVTDSTLKTGQTTRRIAVNRIPTVTITAPGPGDSFGVGTDVTFSANVVDPDTSFGDVVSVSWESDVDGVIGTSNPLILNTLSAGVHNMTVTVTDSFLETDTDTVSSITIVASFTVSGLCQYEDLAPTWSGLSTSSTPKVIRRAEVEIFRDDNSVVIDTTHTDNSGNYSFSVVGALVNTALRVRVMARRSTAAADDMDVHVIRSSDLALYAMTSNTFTGASTVDLTAPSSGSRQGGAFNIFDQFISVTDMVRAVDGAAVFPTLVLLFEIGLDSGGTNYSIETLTGFGSVSRVRLLGTTDANGDTDDYDDAVVMHEIGHYLEDRFSSEGSPGGSHTSSKPTDPGLALGEGVATYVGQVSLGSTEYIDTFRDAGDNPVAGGFDIETSPGGAASTMFGELTVAALLWDLDDAPADGSESFNLPFSDFWTVFTDGVDVKDGEFKSLHTYLDGFVRVSTPTDVSLNAAFSAAPFLVPRPAGGASPPFPLIVYSGSGSTANTVDATKGEEFEGMRHSGAMKFYGLNITGSQSVTITLTIDNSAANDLDLYVESTERAPIESKAGTGSTETIIRTFPVGKYVIYIWAWGDNDTLPAEINAAYTLTITFN